jgi:hypothetical protein
MRFGDDGESQACHYQCVTTLRERLRHWTGKQRPGPRELRTAEDEQAVMDVRLDELSTLARSEAEEDWALFRIDQRRDDDARWMEWRFDPTKLPSLSDKELAQRVFSRRRFRREGAAALLRGRNLSTSAARGLVRQLRHRKPAYREAARDALWGCTITDKYAAVLLAGQLDDPKPELREVARQVLQTVKIRRC